MSKKKLSEFVCAVLLAIICIGLVACGNNDGGGEAQKPLHDGTKWFTDEELSAKGLAGLTEPTGLSGEMNSSDAWYNNGYSFSQVCPDEVTFAANAETYFLYLKTHSLQAINEKELSLTGYFLEQLQALDDTGRHIRIIGKKDLTDRNAVVSIQTPEIDMSQVAWQLDNEYGVMTRVGLHCAPNAHKTLGTYPAGTIRFSFGPENTKNELDFAIQGLKKILDL